MISSPNPLMQLILLLYSGNLVFVIPISWFEGELVFCLVYMLSYLYLIAFNSYLPNLHIAFTYYASLYLVDYAYHCVRMSRDEM
jgi:hypothetical protein